MNKKRKSSVCLGVQCGHFRKRLHSQNETIESFASHCAANFSDISQLFDKMQNNPTAFSPVDSYTEKPELDKLFKKHLEMCNETKKSGKSGVLTYNEILCLIESQKQRLADWVEREYAPTSSNNSVIPSPCHIEQNRRRLQGLVRAANNIQPHTDLMVFLPNILPGKSANLSYFSSEGIPWKVSFPMPERTPKTLPGHQTVIRINVPKIVGPVFQCAAFVAALAAQAAQMCLLSLLDLSEINSEKTNTESVQINTIKAKGDKNSTKHHTIIFPVLRATIGSWVRCCRVLGDSLIQLQFSSCGENILNGQSELELLLVQNSILYRIQYKISQLVCIYTRPFLESISKRKSKHNTIDHQSCESNQISNSYYHRDILLPSLNDCKEELIVVFRGKPKIEKEMIESITESNMILKRWAPVEDFTGGFAGKSCILRFCLSEKLTPRDLVSECIRMIRQFSGVTS